MDADLRLLTSIRLESGRCDLLAFHLDRLQADADALGYGLDRDGLNDALVSKAAQCSQEHIATLRVLVDSQGAWRIEEPLPVHPELPPLQALLWPEPVQSADPLLGHRTTPRRVYDAAFAKVREAGYLDVLFQNELGMVTEGAIHNIFVRHGETWRTPPLRAGVLPGIYRRYLLETRPEITEADVSVAELLAADEVLLSSAVQGLRPVTVAQQCETATASKA